MRRFLPIRIHHIYFGYGWWWGKKFYFFSWEYGLEMMFMGWGCKDAIYVQNCKRIGDGALYSWNKTRQREWLG